MGCKLVRHREGAVFTILIDFEVGAHNIILPHSFAKTHPHLVQAHEERGQGGQHHSSKRLAQKGGIRLELTDPQESHGALRKGD